MSLLLPLHSSVKLSAHDVGNWDTFFILIIYKTKCIFRYINFPWSKPVLESVNNLKCMEINNYEQPSNLDIVRSICSEIINLREIKNELPVCHKLLCLNLLLRCDT